MMTESSSLSVVDNIVDKGINNNKNKNNSNERPLTTASLDFIGSSHAVKDLFALPYSDRVVSVAVHNMEGTLLLDADPDLQPDEQQHCVQSPTWPSLQNDFTRIHNATLKLLDGRENAHEIKALAASLESSSFSTSSTKARTTTESTSNTEEHSSNALTIVNQMIVSNKEDSVPPLNKLYESQASSSTTHNVDRSIRPFHLDNNNNPREYVSWRFQDINMLIGSNALIYRATSTPADKNEATTTSSTSTSSSSTSTSLTVRVEDAHDLQRMWDRHCTAVVAGESISDHRWGEKESSSLPPPALLSKSYAQAVRDQHQVNKLEKEHQSPPLLREENVDSLEAAGPHTCMVPHVPISMSSVLQHTTRSNLMESGENPSLSFTDIKNSKDGNSALSTVLDAYLDNIMANVPQLALCLRERGFIQSIKLLQTDQLASTMMHPSTLDTSTPFAVIPPPSSDDDLANPLFTPHIMEMNALALLRFLQSNCTKDKATYLLRREVGQSTVALYDISAISATRQRKWMWWLAMMSYRFATRLGQVVSATTTTSATTSEPLGRAVRRSYRHRQRNLLHNTLDLLEMLADMDGKVHESLVAAIRESLADTFLSEEGSNNKDLNDQTGQDFPLRPYKSLSADALTKVQDHLAAGIQILEPVVHRYRNEQHEERERSRPSRISSQPENTVVTVDIQGGVTDDSDESDGDDQRGKHDESKEVQTGALMGQLIGMHCKLIDASLRLSEIHLRNYWSSNAMQALRNAARRIADVLVLVAARDNKHVVSKSMSKVLVGLQLQYTWLWEHCGHFARTFAADALWRERGHASGDDVISVLQDVERAFVILREDRHLSTVLTLQSFIKPENALQSASNEMISLHALDGIVDIGSSELQGRGQEVEEKTSKAHAAAKRELEGRNVLMREQRRVLIAAAIAYDRSIEAWNKFVLRSSDPNQADGPFCGLLQRRLGDACNEVGKILLSALRRVMTSSENEKQQETRIACQPLLFSAEFWFRQGLGAFERCNDVRNLVLLRCNLCQCSKLRANATFATSTSTPPTKNGGPTHAEMCLQEAAEHLLAAHASLGERSMDPTSWDMVSHELAETFLVLGVRRRQSITGSGSLPLLLPSLRLTPGQERSIVDPMERALTIYEQVGNQHQTAATHYQLALFYTKIWTCQRDESRTREKLSAAFRHFHAAHAFFVNAIRGNEITFCLVCIDLSSLYLAVSGDKCLKSALSLCLGMVDAFSEEAIRHTATHSSALEGWFQQLDLLLTTVEDRIFKLLRSLVKIGEDNSTNKESIYKDLYRLGLTTKMMLHQENDTQQLIVDDPVLEVIAKRMISLSKLLNVLNRKNQVQDN